MTPKQPYTQVALDDANEGWIRVSRSEADQFIRLKIKGQASKLLTVQEAANLCHALLNECERINRTQHVRRFPKTPTPIEKECQA